MKACPRIQEICRTVNYTQPTLNLISLCREAFKAFDELWVIGPKGDHHKNLLDMGVLRTEQIDLLHVHSMLGVSLAKYNLKPPKGSSDSFEGIFNELSGDINRQIDRVISQDKNVCVLMPHPNSKLSSIIRSKGAECRFIITAPVDDAGMYTKLESKLYLAELVGSATKSMDQSVLIPSVKMESFLLPDIFRQLNVAKGAGLYIQQDVSVGGEGTARVRNQRELDDLLKRPQWRSAFEGGDLKASIEVKNAYSANGSACIVPLADGKCDVYVDPLSYKPTGIREVGMKENCGVGNDWSRAWPEAVQKQYIEATTLIGRELYRKWGYTGIFGPDYLVERTADGEYRLRITEVNPRWQGTTPYQTYNALIVGRLPLELVHYAVKLDRDGSLTKKVIDLLGDAISYNMSSVGSKGCFYIKIGAPIREMKIKNDLNGSWYYDGRKLYRRNTVSHAHLFKASLPHMPLIIKAPPIGSIVGKEFVAIGYIVGRSNKPVFSTDSPDFLEHGSRLFATVKSMLYENIKT